MSKRAAAMVTNPARFLRHGIPLLLLLALCCSSPAVARQRPGTTPTPVAAAPARNYRIGPEDLLEISVYETPDLDRIVRVSADGNISLPLVGAVQAAGLTSRQLEAVLEELLRRKYMKDPHVGVFVKEIKSHPVSVFGAVESPGVYEIRGVKTLVEVLSMAHGVADNAGDTVIVVRKEGLALTGEAGRDSSAAKTSSPSPILRIPLKGLLDSGNPRDNVPIYPGDVVKVTRAGIVYVVGEVRRPGGFTLKTNENISVLQALALAEGLTRTSAAKHALIIRTNQSSGKRQEIPINLDKILKGRAPDPMLRARDIVFVPNSTGRAAFYRGAEAALSIAGGVIIYRR